MSSSARGPGGGGGGGGSNHFGNRILKVIPKKARKRAESEEFRYSSSDSEELSYSSSDSDEYRKWAPPVPVKVFPKSRVTASASVPATAALSLLQTVRAKLESRAAKEERILKAKKVREDIRVKKVKMVELEAKKRHLDMKMSELQIHADYMSEDEMKELEDELEEAKGLVEALHKAGGGKDADANKCPLCLKVPEKVFECDDEACEAWYCDHCKKDLRICPGCRVNLESLQPKRSLKMEKLLRGIM